MSVSYLFNLFGASGVTGLNLYSLLAAVVGAIVFLVVFTPFFGADDSHSVHARSGLQVVANRSAVI